MLFVENFGGEGASETKDSTYILGIKIGTSRRFRMEGVISTAERAEQE